VIERPEVKLQAMIAKFDVSLARQRFGGRVERRALLVRVTMDEVENAVRTGSRTVNEICPSDRTLRRFGNPPASMSDLQSRGSIPSMPMTITF
jgi:hypothetical protein